ncbi:MAG: hypothetical protein RLY40_600 [Pseudomonadota bacterium]|jgi:prophage maintenance system killer protein
MPITLKTKNTSEHNSLNLEAYVKATLDARLKEPFVSKDYSLEDKECLMEGLLMALTFKQLDGQNIIDIFKAMKPDTKAAMRSLTRRGGRCFNITKHNNSITKEGVLDTLNWLDKHQAGYGPRFIIDEAGSPSRHFTNIAELRKGYKCGNNADLAKKLVLKLRNNKETILLVPIMDSLNWLIDDKTPASIYQCPDEAFYALEKQLQEEGHPTYDVVGHKFFQLVDEFSQIEKPSIEEIASFIKSMILLHPFPDGNGRVFTLGVLNSLLYNNGYGICLNLNPHIIAVSESAEIAKDIRKNLITLPKSNHLTTTKQGENEVCSQEVLKASIDTNAETITRPHIEQGSSMNPVRNDDELTIVEEQRRIRANAITATNDAVKTINDKSAQLERELTAFFKSSGRSKQTVQTFKISNEYYSQKREL